MENIFTNLYKYKPQPDINPVENFFTESLKFVLALDAVLLNKFVKYISNGNNFKAPFTLASQVHYGSSIIDLEIQDKNKKKIFVEIKVNAHENRYYDDETADDFGQVEKYLRLNKGHVCFITKDQGNIEVKSHKDKFLGQFEWFEVYRLLEEYTKNDLDKTTLYFISNFLNFMKELDMQPFQGFNKNDIAISRTNFLGFNNKLLDFLQQVKRDRRIVAYLKKHKLQIMSNSPRFFPQSNQFSLVLGKKEWSWHRRIELGFELILQEQFPKYEDGLYYYQGLYLMPKDCYLNFEKVIKTLKVNNKFYNKEFDGFWTLYKVFDFPKFIKSGEKQAITYIYNSLLELERSGVLEVLEKVK